MRIAELISLSESERFAAPSGISDIGGTPFFWAAKRGCDIGFSLLLMLPLMLCCLVLLALNPIWNRGPLFFTQIRMGRGCRAFKAVKFRTMRCAPMRRGPDDPIEADRITALGRFLRTSRIDELPQILNVLRGDMSLIGPRPDYFTHARSYLRHIPEYRRRHAVRPGISGLAQIELGYVEGLDGTRCKALADLRYIREASFALDLEIFLRTIWTVLARKGA